MTAQIVRVDWEDPRAALLREAMDAELGPRYADRNPDFTEAQRAAHQAAFVIDPATLVGVFLVLAGDGAPAGHAALRRHRTDGGTDDGIEYELKKVVVLDAYRGRGYAGALVRAVEDAARAEGADRLILQTGDRQPEAVGLYEKLGYRPIAPYPPYDTVAPESLFYGKAL